MSRRRTPLPVHRVGDRVAVQPGPPQPRPPADVFRYEARVALCEGCRHYTPAPRFGKYPQCALCPPDPTRGCCQQGHFQRLLWSGAAHPHPDCPWHASGA